MKVTLLHHTPLGIADKAIGKCWDKPKEECDVARIDRVANKHKHGSTIEHLTYNFDIDGISRALLQELARHRMANLSVKSSRYTLKELLKEQTFYSDVKNKLVPKEMEPRAKKYLVETPSQAVNIASVQALEALRCVLTDGISNDLAKYCMPEAYKTSLVWTCNARALQNFLVLRTNKSALWEIRELAYEIFNQLPDDHKFLFKDSLYKEEPKFKVGDWIVNTTHAKPYEPMIVTQEMLDDKSPHNNGVHLELWAPTEGEWCVFYDEPDEDSPRASYIISKFERIVGGKNKYREAIGRSWFNIAPLEFVKTLKDSLY